MAPFTHLFISKNRKVNFELSLIIRDLINVPLVSGYYYVNWKLKNAASHTSGTTARIQIKDHQVTWNHPINTIVQLVTNKQQLLGSCELKLEIYQQQKSTMIGSLVINLSEYAGSGVTTERYLLQDCKFNSTIKLSLRMNINADSADTTTTSPSTPQTTHFITPPISRQQIFKDIPTIVQHQKRIIKQETLNHINITNTSSSSSPRPPLIQAIRKSQSVMSLPNYCKIHTYSEEPSPVDLVEQLFAAKSSTVINPLGA